MNEVQKMREKIIETIKELPEDKLAEVNILIKKILLKENNSIENIYTIAKEKYNKTLQKLAK
jgi:hypothetical protein